VTGTTDAEQSGGSTRSGAVSRLGLRYERPWSHCETFAVRGPRGRKSETPGGGESGRNQAGAVRSVDGMSGVLWWRSETKGEHAGDQASLNQTTKTK